MTVPSLDGTGTGVGVSSTSVSATLTTTNTNDEIIAAVWYYSTRESITGVTATGLSFTKRSHSSVSAAGVMEIWGAPSTGTLTGVTITVNFSASVFDSALVVFGVSGTYLSSPWDSNASVPANNGNYGSWTPSFSGITASQTNSFAIFAVGATNASIPDTIPAGYTKIASTYTFGGVEGAYICLAYISSTSAYSGTATWGGPIGAFSYSEAIFDILTGTAHGGAGTPLPALSPQLLWRQRQPRIENKPINSGRPRPLYLSNSLSPAAAVVKIDGIGKEVLLSGLTTSPLQFDGLVREVLVSAAATGSSAIIFDALYKVSLQYIIPLTFLAIPIFPVLPQGFPVKVSIVMDTTIGTTKSLREMRVAQQQFPIWDIEIPFEELRDQTQNQTAYAPFAGYIQYEALVQLWLSMYGQTQVFGFDCPWDNSRSNQQIGTGDGSTYAFTIYRTWGTGANATTAPVGLVNTVSQVQVNGITINAAHYQILRNKIYFVDSLGFVYPPGAGLAITMTFSYYYLCRFTEDEQDFEEFAKNRWTVPSLKFRAVIWN